MKQDPVTDRTTSAEGSASGIAHILRNFGKKSSAQKARGEWVAAMAALQAAGANDAVLRGLDLLRASLDRWDAPDAAFLPAWRELTDARDAGLSEAVGIEAVRLLPKKRNKRDALSADELLDLNLPWLLALVRAGRVTKAELGAVSRKHPARAAAGPVVDVLVEAGQAVPPNALRELWGKEDRGSRLMSPSHVIVRSLALDASPATAREVDKLVADTPEPAQAMIRELATDSGAALRYTWWLSDPGPEPHRRRRRLQVQARLKEWADLLVERARNGDEGVLTALTLIRTVATQEDTAAGVVVRELAANLEALTVEKGTSWLRHVEVTGSGVLAIGPRELEATFYRYAELSDAVTGGFGAERSARDKLLQASSLRAVLQDIASRAAVLDPDSDARRPLEAVLLNQGVLPFGVPGTSEPFDRTRHETSWPGLVDGDPVRLLRSGYERGTGDYHEILARAEVQPES